MPTAIARVRVIAPAVAGLVVGLGGAWLAFATGPGPREGVSASEAARAERFLAAHEVERPRSQCPLPVPLVSEDGEHPCSFEGYADVDGDGVADCWRGNVSAYRMDIEPTLDVWPGCRGDAIHLDNESEILLIPDVLAREPWLSWVAARFVGADRVERSTDPDLDPAWRWVMASVERRREEPGVGGRVTPSWHDGPAPVAAGPRALIVPSVPAGWMERARDVLGTAPPDAPAGTRILIESDDDPVAFPGRPEIVPATVRCAGLDVSAVGEGLLARDGARWAWVFRAPPEYGGFSSEQLLCANGLVMASSTDQFSSTVVVDPRSGGWLFEPDTDAGRFSGLVDYGDGAPTWHRDGGAVVSLGKLALWLASPVATRGPVNALDARHFDGLTVEPFDRQHVGDHGEMGSVESLAEIGAHDSLPNTVTCGGWTIRWSADAVLSENRTDARWLWVSTSPWIRADGVRCDGRRVVVSRRLGVDRMNPAAGNPKRDELVLNLASSTWLLRPLQRR